MSNLEASFCDNLLAGDRLVPGDDPGSRPRVTGSARMNDAGRARRLTTAHACAPEAGPGLSVSKTRSAMSHRKSPGIATNEELNSFFAVGNGKRIEILKALGLSTSRQHDWTTIWVAIGLAAVQRRKLWDDLRAPLLDVADVAGIIGKHPKTVSGWCKRNQYPLGFPIPFDFGPRSKRWISLEVWSYRQPELYRKLACGISRPSPSLCKVLQPPVGEVLPTTLKPIPFP